VEDINNEIFTLLGYHRDEVIGKNIAMLMPKAVGALHDQFIRRYLETAESRQLNK
jgi:PAS domain S-box-containing protein